MTNGMRELNQCIRDILAWNGVWISTEKEVAGKNGKKKTHSDY